MNRKISEMFYSPYGFNNLTQEQRHKAILIQGTITNVLRSVTDIDFNTLEDIYDILRKQITSNMPISEIRDWANKNITVRKLSKLGN